MKARYRRIWIYAGIIFLTLFAGILWALPRLAAYYLEKNDRQWIGREVTVSDIDFNLFTGEMEVEDLVVYEDDGERTFFSVQRLETNLAMWSLLNSLLELEYVRLESPRLVIEQEVASFNFDDLLAHFDQDSAAAGEDSDPVRYVINDVKVSLAQIAYRDLEIDAELSLEQLNIYLPLITDTHPGVAYELDLAQKEGGVLKVSGEVNWEDHFNDNRIEMTDWTLRPYKNYLNAYLNIEDFDGRLEGNIRMGMNYSDSGYVATSGKVSLRDFFLVDTRKDSLMQVALAELTVDSVHTGIDKYEIGHFSMVSPQVVFKFFESSDNFSQLYVGESEATLDTVNLAQKEIVFENPFQYISDYIAYFIDEDVLNTFEMDSAVIRNGGLVFQDFSRLEDALIVMDDFNAHTERISSSDSLLKISFDSRLNQFGEFLGKVEFERRDLTNFTFLFDVQNFYLSAFDPYSKHYTAHPMWEGTLNLTSETQVRARYLNSDNRVLIMQPEVGRKLDIDTEYNIPLRFAFALLKDVQGNVDFTFPIEGDLDDPDYKLGPVILKVIMNLLSKAVASPYKLLARTLDADEEDLKAIRFGVNQDSLAAPQLKSLSLLARVLENKPDLKAELDYLMNEKEEKDQIALSYAKSAFLAQLADSLKTNYASADGVDNRDSLFVEFLNSQTGGMGTSSVANMSRKVLGEETLNARIQELRDQHHDLVENYLFGEKQLDSTRVVIMDIADQEKMNTVIRPTFIIRYNATEYSAEDSVSGPAPQPALPVLPSASD